MWTPKPGLFGIIPAALFAKREGDICTFAGNGLVADKTSHGRDCELHSRKNLCMSAGFVPTA